MEIPEPRHYEFEVWQDGECVASVGGADYDGVKSEAFHYALMYAQDGVGVIVKDVTDDLAAIRGDNTVLR